MKKIPFWFFLGVITCAVSFAQTLPTGISPAQAAQLAKGASDQQLLVYITMAKNQGFTLDQLKGQITSQGGTAADIAKLERLWKDEAFDALDSKESAVPLEPIKSDFGKVSYRPTVSNNPSASQTADAQKQERFGANFFQKGLASPKETPELYLATPSDYRLGPGDELVIDLYGASENTYPVQVSREGTIKVERLSPIYVSGLSVAEAKKRLTQKFATIYQGLQPGVADFKKVELDLSLKTARSIVVNITGQVNEPGTYTISGFSSVLNALYAAGGPNEVGSYRAINLLRAGKTIAQIDLYDFFVSGLFPNIYLQDQDVIQVPSFESQVSLQGAFKTQGLFELKQGETFQDVMSFSGGFQSEAYKSSVFLSRIQEFKRVAFTIDTAKDAYKPLFDGDIITANSVKPVLENTVRIEGEVYVPGAYSLDAASTLAKLITLAQGYTPEALTSRAILYRFESGAEQQSVFIDLKNAESLLQPLKNGDRLVILSASEISDLGKVSVVGAVNSPGTFEYKNGMSVGDALILANGFSVFANTNEVEIYRNQSVTTSTYGAESFKVRFNKELEPSVDVELYPDDLIVVRENPGYQNMDRIRLDGFVLNKGTYVLKGENYRLYDLFVEAKGFMPNANLKGIQVKRKVLTDRGTADAIRQAIKEEAKGNIDQSTDELLSAIENEEIVIGINGERLLGLGGQDSPDNLVLQNGDVIFVPKLDNTITLIGGVQQKTKFSFRKGLSVSQAIRQAGGYSDSAKKSKTYVVYQNGTIKPRRHLFGLLRNDPILESGATIIVPEKTEKKSASRSAGELIGIASSLGSLALIIQNVLTR